MCQIRVLCHINKHKNSQWTLKLYEINNNVILSNPKMNEILSLEPHGLVTGHCAKQNKPSTESHILAALAPVREPQCTARQSAGARCSPESRKQRTGRKQQGVRKYSYTAGIRVDVL